MIIESSLATTNGEPASTRRRLVRRTEINADNLQSVLQRLLAQWDISAHEPFSLLIAIDGNNGSHDQQRELIVDKQDEWELFCRGTTGTDVVRAELIKSSLIRGEGQSSSLTTSTQAAAPENTAKKEQVQPADSEPPQLKPPQKITYAFQSPEERPAKTSPAQFGFQTIDPQPVKPRKGFSYEEIEQQKREKEKLASQATAIAASSSATAPNVSTSSAAQQAHQRQAEIAQDHIVVEPRPMTAYERVMARSRLQGEALNRAFGTLQARSAGKQYTPQDEGESISQQSGEQQIDRDANLRQTPVSPGQTATMVEQTEVETAPSPAADEEPAPSSEAVVQHNARLGDAWQDRLAQMGHRPGSGSHYAKLRFGKGKDRDVEGDEAGLSPNNVAVSQTINGSDSIDQAGPSRSRMMSDNGEGSYGELGDLPSVQNTDHLAQDVLGLMQDEAHSPHLVTTAEERGPHLSASSRIKASFSRRRLFSNRRKSVGNSLQPQSASSTRPGTPQSMADMSTFSGLRSSPPSVMQHSPRERRLSLRSLTESILQASALRSGSFNHDLHTRIEPTSSPATGTTTPDVGPSSRASTHKRLSLQTRSLSDANLLPRLMRRRRSSVVPTHDLPGNSQRNIVAHPGRNMEEITQGVRPRDAMGRLVEQDNSSSSEAIAMQGSHDTPQSHGDSRPSLLRAAYTMQSSQTAVDLASAGGITLTLDHAKHARESAAVQTRHRPVRDLFDLMLPREIRVACFAALVQLHEEEDWRLDVKSKNGAPHIGRPAALRELVRLSRVSKTWQSLVLDGQLWSTLDTTAIPNISRDSLTRIIRTAGPAIKRINYQNLRQLDTHTLSAMSARSTSKRTQNARLSRGHLLHPQRGYSAPQLDTAFEMITSTTRFALPSLTHLSLEGFQPNISSSALHRLLVRLPQLTHLNLANLSAVDDDTLLILGASTPHLQSLNVSRCRNVWGPSITGFIEAAQGALLEKRGQTHRRFASSGSLKEEETSSALPTLNLRELRVAGIVGLYAHHMQAIGANLPLLEVLDLSYALDLRDDAFEAFVHHTGPAQELASPSHSPLLSARLGQTPPVDTSYVTLSPRQAGADVLSDDVYYRRLHSNLQYLSLASCRRLSDRFAIHLAHSVPNLRVLEASNIGPNLHDDGLIKLLETTPLIERIDVEHCLELNLGFVRALTPPKDYVRSLGIDVPSDNEDDDAQEEAHARRGRRRARSRRDMSQANTAAEARQQRAAASATAAAGGSASAARSSAPEVKPRTRVWRRPTPTGAHLTHLIMSSLHRVPAKDILALVRHCPNLIHLEVDDTRVNDAILKEFVSQARTRKKHNAYISLVDCRNLAKDANTYVFEHGQARARDGHIGWPYAGFLYEGQDVTPDSQTMASSVAATSHEVQQTSARQSTAFEGSFSNTAPDNGRDRKTQVSNEYDDSLVVVKTFWAWQAVDERIRARRKAESKKASALARQAAQHSSQTSSTPGSRPRSRGGLANDEGNGQHGTAGTFARLRRDSLGAALQFISRGSAGHTYEQDLGGAGGNATGRFAGTRTPERREVRAVRDADVPVQVQTGLLGPGHEADDSRGCLIM